MVRLRANEASHVEWKTYANKAFEKRADHMQSFVADNEAFKRGLRDELDALIKRIERLESAVQDQQTAMSGVQDFLGFLSLPPCLPRRPWTPCW